MIISNLCVCDMMLMADKGEIPLLLMGGHTYEQYLLSPPWLLPSGFGCHHRHTFSGDRQLRSASTNRQSASLRPSGRAQFSSIRSCMAGGVWIGIATAGAESFKWWKAALIALLSFGWPMLLMSALLR
jgi:hypothetical protein